MCNMTNAEENIFRRKLETIRYQENWSQKIIADKLKISQGFISKLESGKIRLENKQEWEFLFEDLNQAAKSPKEIMSIAKERGISLNKLALASGTTKPTIEKWIRGEKTKIPSFRLRYRLKRFLKI